MIVQYNCDFSRSLGKGYVACDKVMVHDSEREM